MQMAVLLALVLVVAFVSFRVLLPAKPKAGLGQPGARRLDKTGRRGGDGAGNPFHAVSIHPPAGGCLAAQAIKGERFLSGEAPGLPLEGCTEPNCHCRYMHHVDRRSGNGDRRLVFGIRHDTPVFAESGERRVTAGRREADDLEAA